MVRKETASLIPWTLICSHSRNEGMPGAVLEEWREAFHAGDAETNMQENARSLSGRWTCDLNARRLQML